MTLFSQANEWRAGMQDVSAAIDDTMGEAVTVTPARSDKPNFPCIPEPERAVTVTAVFSNRAKAVFGGEHRYGSLNISPIVSTSEPIFSFGYDALPWPLLQGYRILLHRTGETFEVTDVKPDGVSRIIAKVVQLGRSREGEPSTRNNDDPRVPPLYWSGHNG